MYRVMAPFCRQALGIVIPGPGHVIVTCLKALVYKAIQVQNHRARWGVGTFIGFVG